MIAETIFVLAGLLPAFAAAFYHLGLAVLRLVGVSESRTASTDPTTHFTFLIPAHNEQTTIDATLRSCQQVDYPAAKLRTIVIADNCHDQTAERATDIGAEVWVRQEPDNAGKGQALAWAFRRLLTTQRAQHHVRSDGGTFDGGTSDDGGQNDEAVIVLDADCTIDAPACRVLDAYLRQGADVLQTNHSVSNLDATPISYAAGVGRALEYDLGFAPKSRLGLSVMLVGTGMVFRRELLEQDPWNATSSAEDTEYTLHLAEAGRRVRFATDAAITCASVETTKMLQVQRSRWAAGNLSLGKRRAIQMMLQGLGRGDLLQFDLGWSLLIASRPLVLLHAALVIVAAAALWLAEATLHAQTLLVVSLALLPLYGLYFAIGIFWVGINRKRLAHLLAVPAVLCELIVIAVRALIQGESKQWNRTPREQEQA